MSAATAGNTLLAEVTGGNLDSLIGLYDYGTGALLSFDDDGGAGLLSRLVYPISADGLYALAVTTYADFDFNGDAFSGGRYCLDVSTVAGEFLDLGDDDHELVNIGFSFPYQGANWPSVYVNSNGNLTFGSGDTDFTESVSEFLNEAPRIAPLWDDLSPNNGGTVLVNRGADYMTVAFDGVPEFFATGSTTFAVTLHASGDVTVEHGAVPASDGIVGVTEGGFAADPGETDLPAAVSLSAGGTTYERFAFSDPFDLSNTTLLFEAP